MTRFADGTGAWVLLEIVLLSDEAPRDVRPGTHVVRTPLDLICLLEERQIGEVVLGGTFARTSDIHAFLRESYPRLVVANQVADEPVVARNRETALANASD